VVLFVGRLIKCKGIMTLLNVIEKNKDNKDIAFVFIGEGPLSEKLVEAEIANKSIFFLGRINNNNLPLYYNAADVVIMPSQYEEGYGRVLLEAFSCGVPVIAAKRGGITEVVNDSVGILIEPDEKGINQALKSLLEDRNRLKVLAGNCRLHAEKVCGFNNALVIEESYN